MRGIRPRAASELAISASYADGLRSPVADGHAVLGGVEVLVRAHSGPAASDRSHRLVYRGVMPTPVFLIQFPRLARENRILRRAVFMLSDVLAPNAPAFLGGILARPTRTANDVVVVLLRPRDQIFLVDPAELIPLPVFFGDAHPLGAQLPAEAPEVVLAAAALHVGHQLNSSGKAAL